MMLLLFGVDTISVMVNALILKKFTDVNLLREFCLILKKYWLFMAVKLAFNMMVYFIANDINFGNDGTRSFTWISDEGWIQLVNSSKDLSYEEKAELFGKRS